MRNMIIVLYQFTISQKKLKVNIYFLQKTDKDITEINSLKYSHIH